MWPRKHEENALVIPFTLPELLSRRLAVRTGGIFSDPALLVDGRPVSPSRDGVFTVVSEGGAPVHLRLIGRGIDLVPDVRVGDEDDARTVQILPPLQVWEYAWCLLPVFALLVFFRGPLSGLIGALITYANLRLFRGLPSPAARFVVTALVSAASVAAYYGVGYLLLTPFRAPR